MAGKKRGHSGNAKDKQPTKGGGAATPAKTGAEHRRHERVNLDLLVQVRSKSLEAFRTTHARNISVGGMFIVAGDDAQPERALGTELYFQFTLDGGGTLIEGLGRVVHASKAGLGIEFVNVLEPSVSIIHALVNDRVQRNA